MDAISSLLRWASFPSYSSTEVFELCFSWSTNERLYEIDSGVRAHSPPVWRSICCWRYRNMKMTSNLDHETAKKRCEPLGEHFSRFVIHIFSFYRPNHLRFKKPKFLFSIVSPIRAVKQNWDLSPCSPSDISINGSLTQRVYRAAAINTRGAENEAQVRLRLRCHFAAAPAAGQSETKTRSLTIASGQGDLQMGSQQCGFSRKKEVVYTLHGV